MSARQLLWASGGLSAACLGLWAGAAVSAGPKVEPQGAARSFGFAITEIYHDVDPEDPKACPEGLNEGHRELYLKVVDPAERKRLSEPDNARELHYGQSSLNLAGKPMCLDPDGAVAEAMRPDLKVVQGAGPALGLDLDGQTSRVTSQTCAHENFRGRDGSAGVDNQFYRVFGCVAGYRSGGILHKSQYGSEIKNGSWDVLMEVNNVDDLQNDDDVDVSIFSSQDPAPFAGGVVATPYKSLSIVDDRRYWTTAKGRIIDGVLTTDPTDLRFLVSPPVSAGEKPDGSKGREAYIRGARLKLNISAEGAKGVLAGYVDIETFDRNNLQYNGHNGFATGAAATSMYSCPSVRTALQRYADGYPDPTTKRCTAISTAFSIEAIPAFIIKRGVGSGVAAG